MTIEVDLVARLRAWPGLAALVAARIYPAPAPQGVIEPFVVYERRDTERVSTFGGDAGVTECAFMVECFAKSRAEARSVRDQVRRALQRWSGSGTVTVFDSFVTSEGDGPFDATTGRFRGDVAATIWASEP